MRTTRSHRAAFTLIELLVVMALIVVIFGLGAGYMVFGQADQHSVTAAQAVTGALLNAKQRARRDGVPTGVRVLFNGGTQATQLQFIQQPDDYTVGTCQGNSGFPTPSNTVNFANDADFLGGAGASGEVDEATVQAGDYLYVGSTLHRIAAVSGQNLTIPTQSTVAPNSLFHIIRGPRRLPSEDVITLPSSVVIDQGQSNAGGALPVPTAKSDPEILFAPGGGLIGQNTGADKVYLWICAPAPQAPTAGSPLIIAIQVRTGIIGVYPVASGDPFAFARDPRASGM